MVAGISFIGAGTIIVTKRQRVKGLATAAGLWTAAIIGRALGGGFYEGALVVTLLVLTAELVFSQMEYRLLSRAPEINLYVEYADKASLEQIIRRFRETEIKILNMKITRSTGSEKHNTCVIFSLRHNKKCPAEQVLAITNTIEGVVLVEEL